MSEAHSSLLDQAEFQDLRVEVEGILSALAWSGGAADIFATAFGTDHDPGAASKILDDWRAGDFSFVPKVQMVSAESLDGAAGAYVSATNTILLSASFADLSVRPVSEIARVVVEEIGHALDATLNVTDVAGDEGEIFADLAFGDVLDMRALATLKTEDDHGTAVVDGVAYEVEQSGLISQSTVDSFKNGLNSALDSIESAMANKVLNQALPLFDTSLKSAFDAGQSALRGIRTYKEAVYSALNALSDPSGAGYTEDVIENAVNQALQNAGFGPLAFNINGSEWSLAGAQSFTPFSKGLASNLGLGNMLQASTTGSAQLGVSYGVNLTVGTDATGFYVKTDGTNSELTFGLDATVPNLGGGLVLGNMLRFSAQDLGSSMGADFTLNLQDSDGKLRLDELGSNFMSPSVTGGLDLDARFSTDMGSTALPSFTTDFGVEWNFQADSSGFFGSTPKVSFANTKLDFGSFVENILKPFVANLTPALNPVKEIIKLLKADIGFMHQLPGADLLYDKVDGNGLPGQDGKITLLDFAKIASPGTEMQAAIVFIEALDKLIAWSDFLSLNVFPTIGAYSLGSFEISSDIRDATFNLSSAGRTVTQAAENLQNFITTNYAGVNGTTLANFLAGDPTDPNDDPGAIASPFLTEASSAMAYLFGQHTNLLRIELPEFGLSFGGAIDNAGNLTGPLTDLLNIPIPLVPGLSVEVEGALRAAIDLGFGYDTRGLEQYVTSNYTNTGALANGFFLTDWDSNGNERPEIKLGAQINFGLGFGIDFLAKAFGGGAIEGLVLLDLVDTAAGGAADGKVYFDELASSLSNPFELFEGRALITASLIAYATLFGQTVWQVRSPGITLGDFPFGGETGDPFDPNLATLQEDDGLLIVHSGPNASLRAISNKADGNENFTIVKGPGSSIGIVAFGYQQRFVGATAIDADGGNGNDVISVAEDVVLPTSLSGGFGDDVIYGGGGSDTIRGGANVDGLFGGVGDDWLYGDEQDDVLDGGAGADYLDGGAGSGDIVTYAVSDVSVQVSLATGVGTGGDAEGDTLTGIEHLVGANLDGVGDSLTGSGVANIINGLKGNDTLRGGGGDDTLIGGDGDDVLDGGSGTDVLSGGVGNDIYYVDRVGVGGDVIDEARFGPGGGRDRILAFVDISMAGLTDIEDLTLTGNAHIGEGNALANLINGAGGEDELRGLGGTDDLRGNGGADTLDGGADTDTLRGGLGDDVYIINDNDQIIEVSGEGFDRVVASIDYVLTAGAAVERMETDDAAGTDPLSLRGNTFAQRLVGNAGDNVLEGMAGADTLEGGGGYDIASYETAAAAIKLNFTTGVHTGDAAGDQFIGISEFRGSNLEASGDLMTGAGGVDRFNGLAGNDTLYGLGGNDILFGGAGADSLDGGTGIDTMAGGSGDDTYYVDSLNDVVDDDRAGYLTGGGGGRDTIIASLDYSLAASSERNDIEDLVITGAARRGTGNGLSNRITGTTGNDTLDGLGGSDDLRGGDGNDIYIFDTLSDRVVEDLNQGTDEIRVQTVGITNEGGIPTLDLSEAWAVNVEHATLVGDFSSVHLTGNSLANRLVGNRLSQTLSGGTGNDTLDVGFDGRDTAHGGADFDTLVVDWSASTRYIRYTNDYRTSFTDFTGTLADGYAGTYYGSLSDYYNRVDFTGIERFQIKLGSGFDQVRTGDSNDTVSGGAGNDHLITGAGLDVVDGGANDFDAYLGGDRWEADKSAFGATAIVIDVNLTGVQATYGAGSVSGIEMLTLKTGGGADVIRTYATIAAYGTSGFDDAIETNAGNDRVEVFGGRDTVSMGTGSDTLVVDWSQISRNIRYTNDYRTSFTDFAGTFASGYTGTYYGDLSDYYNRIDFSGVEQFNIKLGSGFDQVRTGDGADTVSGGAGNDHLITGLGTDVIDGGTDDRASGSGGDRWEADKSNLGSTSPMVLDLNLTGIQATYSASATVRGIEMLTLKTGAGADVIRTFATVVEYGTSGFDDVIETNAGNDRVEVFGGRDSAALGTGTDTLVVDWSTIGRSVRYTDDFRTSVTTFNGTLAAGYSGTYYGDLSDYYNRVDFSGVEKFNIKLGSGNDQVMTGDGDDTVSGGSGDDLLITGKGLDIIDGGAGNDRWQADKSFATAVQPIALDLNAAGLQSTYFGTGTVRGIEMLTLKSGAGNDDIRTYQTLTDISTFGFDDVVETNAGNDRVDVFGGRDAVAMGDGVDTLVVDWSQIYRSARSTVDYRTTITDFAGSLDTGYAGTYYGELSDYYNRVDFSGVEKFDIKLGSGFDQVRTGDGADTVSGGAGNDHLITGQGIDVIDGGDNDFASGSGGDRWESDQSALDAATPMVLDLNSSFEQAAYGGSGSVRGIEMLTLKTGAGDDLIKTFGTMSAYGTSGFDDAIETNGGNDRVEVFGGRDTVSMGAGTDTLVVDWSQISRNIRYTTDYRAAVTTFSGTLADGYAGTFYGDLSDYYNKIDFSGVERFVVWLGAGSDQIMTGDGDDNIRGGQGDDLLITGKGADTIDGGWTLSGSSFVRASDRWHADKSNATIGMTLDLNSDEASTYVVEGRTGSVANIEALGIGAGDGERFATGSGNDTIITRGDNLSDFIETNAGNDRVTVANGRDVISMGAGSDTLTVDWSALGYDVRYANDYRTAFTTFGGSLAEGYAGTYYGGPSDFYNRVDFSGVEHFNILLGSGNDQMLTGAGNDTLDGGAGIDTLEGGAGNDTYGVDSQSDQVIEASGGGNDTIRASLNYVLAAGLEIENLRTALDSGTQAINLTGNERAQTLTGNAGDNILDGGGGADTMAGGAGDDTFLVDVATDRAVEAANGGFDRVLTAVSYALAAGQFIEELATTNDAGTGAINLTGNEVAQSLIGNAGANTLNGGAGADTMTGFAGNDIYLVDNVGDQVIEAAGQGTDSVRASVSYILQAGASVEELRVVDLAGTQAINLTGNELAQTLIGNAGNNSLNGGSGADILSGREGNDIYFVDNASDRIMEAANQGQDSVRASISYTLQAGVSVEELRVVNLAGTEVINLYGNELAQTLVGNAGNNLLDGKGGADILSGREGNDIYLVDNALDLVVEAAGQGRDSVRASVSYSLQAGREIEELRVVDLAGTQAINLTGNELAQTVIGNAGANTLNGGAGADVLSGREGADNFVFSTTLGSSNVDRIVDFVSGVDHIHLDDAIFSGLALGSLAASASAFQIGSANDAGDRILYTPGDGKIAYDADGNGAGAAQVFAVLNPNTTLMASDFLII